MWIFGTLQLHFGAFKNKMDRKIEFLMVVLVKYIILKKIQISVQRPLKQIFSNYYFSKIKTIGKTNSWKMLLPLLLWYLQHRKLVLAWKSIRRLIEWSRPRAEPREFVPALVTSSHKIEHLHRRLVWNREIEVNALTNSRD